MSAPRQAAAADRAGPPPIVHLNGTSRAALLAGYCEAWRAIEDAIRLLCNHAPHGRDYYVSPDPDAYVKARAAHDARIARLQDVADELEALADAIQNN